VFGAPWILLAVGAAAVVAVAVPLLRPRPRVPIDLGPLAEAVLEVLPGGNCGACGNGSCFETAAAIASGRVSRTVCAAGGPATAAAVASVLRSHSGEASAR
jgi:Na+-translocating ferredoxin:NAD+ oxidoreductase RNF subunit RnfB